MRIKELMTSHAEWIEASTPLRDVSRTLRDKNIGCLPVGESDRLIGMIQRPRELCHSGGRRRARPRQGDGARRDDRRHRLVLRRPDRQGSRRTDGGKGIRHLPVLNRKKRIVGVLSLGDLAFRVGKSLTADVIHLVSRDAERHAKSA